MSGLLLPSYAAHKQWDILTEQPSSGSDEQSQIFSGPIPTLPDKWWAYRHHTPFSLHEYRPVQWHIGFESKFILTPEERLTPSYQIGPGSPHRMYLLSHWWSVPRLLSPASFWHDPVSGHARKKYKSLSFHLYCGRHVSFWYSIIQFPFHHLKSPHKIFSLYLI